MKHNNTRQRASKVNGAHGEISAEQAMAANIATTLETVENAESNSCACTLITEDELTIMGVRNSELITLELTNISAAPIIPIDLSFGTPLGLPGSYTQVPEYAKLTNFWLDNLADVTDNQGGSAPFFQLLNSRFVRHACLISQIQIVTDDSALGITQRQERIRFVEVPYNSADDSTTKTGGYNPQFTEYTASNMLRRGTILGEFHGFVYTLLGSSFVQINMMVHAIDQPNFKI